MIISQFTDTEDEAQKEEVTGSRSPNQSVMWVRNGGLGMGYGGTQRFWHQIIQVLPLKRVKGQEKHRLGAATEICSAVSLRQDLALELLAFLHPGGLSALGGRGGV